MKNYVLFALIATLALAVQSQKQGFQCQSKNKYVKCPLMNNPVCGCISKGTETIAAQLTSRKFIKEISSFISLNDGDCTTFSNSCFACIHGSDWFWNGQCENQIQENQKEQEDSSQYKEQTNNGFLVSYYQKFKFLKEIEKKSRVYCEVKRPQVCTMEYNPVCGYNDKNEEISSYGNGCSACGDRNVIYYIIGQC